MGDSGIISQYGFLYQRKVFTWYVLSTLNVNSTYTFEGKDDIEINTDNKIYAIGDKINNTYIQVKSGNIDKNCLAKVFCNWLALDDIENSQFILFSEKNIEIEKILPNNVDDIIQYIERCQDKKSTSVGNQIYHQYRITEKNKENLKKDLEYIYTNINIEIIPINELELKIKNKFFDNYCLDNLKNTIVNEKRLDRFISYLYNDIDRAIQDKNTYVLEYRTIFDFIKKAVTEISESKYTIDIMKTKPKFKKQAEKILNTISNREIEQLKLIRDKRNFIIKGLTDEIFYKDFREVYIEYQSNDISNIEASAFDNYENIILLGAVKTPYDIYSKILEKPINADLLPNEGIYQNGCYIFLTSDNVDKSIQISWELKDDEDE